MSRFSTLVTFLLMLLPVLAAAQTPAEICDATGYSASGSYKQAWNECVAYVDGGDLAPCRRAGDHRALCEDVYRHLGDTGQKSRCTPWKDDAELGVWCDAAARRSTTACGSLTDTVTRKHCKYLVTALARHDASKKQKAPVERPLLRQEATRDLFDPKWVGHEDDLEELADEVSTHKRVGLGQRELLKVTAADPRMQRTYSTYFDLGLRTRLKDSLLDTNFLIDRVLDHVPIVGSVRTVSQNVTDLARDEGRLNAHNLLSDTLADPERVGQLWPKLEGTSAAVPTPLVLTALATLAGHRETKKWVRKGKAGWGTVSLAVSALTLGASDLIPSVGDLAVDGVSGLVADLAGDELAKHTVTDLLLEELTKPVVDKMAETLISDGLASSVGSLATPEQEDAIRESLSTEARKDGLKLEDEDLAAATENVLQYLRTRALLAYLGARGERKLDAKEAEWERARLQMKLRFGSPPTEHLDPTRAHVFDVPLIDDEGDPDGTEQAVTGLSNGQYLWYHYVAMQRGPDRSVWPASLREEIDRAEPPSPLAILWQTERIWETLQREVPEPED